MTTSLFVLMVTAAFSDGSITVIKVNGPYGIISKGVNQGLQEGQVLFARRDDGAGETDICKVKIIRATANRAAIEQVSRPQGTVLMKGDVLYERGTETAVRSRQTRGRARIEETFASRSPDRRSRPQTTIEPLTEPAHNPPPTETEEVYRPPSRRVYSTVEKLRKPWLGFQVGGMFPGGQFSNTYSASPKYGLSYMVATGNHFNLGVELNHSSLSGSAFGSSSSFSNDTSSMLEALVVFQKFFGDHFFLEGGGGVFRPKLRLTSVDDVETTYSSTHFGFVGGGGFVIPTSPFAGFMMKGRLHNYFDATSKHYFGLSGGFRFKIR